jgi:hypothetical protein
MGYRCEATGYFISERNRQLRLVCLSSVLLLYPSMVFAAEGSKGGFFETIFGFIFACIFWSVLFSFFKK